MSAQVSGSPDLVAAGRVLAELDDWRSIVFNQWILIGVLVALIAFLIVVIVRSNKPVLETIIPVRLAMEAAKTAVESMSSQISALIRQMAALVVTVEANGKAANDAVDKLNELQTRLAALEQGAVHDKVN